MADDPQDLLRLADEVEKATGPDTVLDAAIWLHLPEQAAHAWKHGGNKFKHARQIAGCAFVPLCTASLDAAMTLIPTVDRWHTRLAMEDRHSHSWRWELRGGFGWDAQARAATAPLALCAAALKARAHSTKDTSNVG